MLRAVGLVAQWRTIARSLPAGWTECRLVLETEDGRQADRAARLLGPLSPGRSEDSLVLRAELPGAAALERLLSRLDEEGIAGTLDVAATTTAATGRDERRPELAEAWDGLAAGLPEDWSDLLCLVELTSSDDLGPAALELAPLNPSRHGKTLGFRFRAARSFGYGAAPQMARRCLARLDERGIPGSLILLEALSSTRPVLTQGPTFTVGGRAV